VRCIDVHEFMRIAQQHSNNNNSSSSRWRGHRRL
jgi:hypothetical protein